jgi:hypothetical protein
LASTAGCSCMLSCCTCASLLCMVCSQHCCSASRSSWRQGSALLLLLRCVARLASLLACSSCLLRAPAAVTAPACSQCAVVTRPAASLLLLCLLQLLAVTICTSLPSCRCIDISSSCSTAA